MTTRSAHKKTWFALMCIMLSPSVHGAVTDIANAPLVTSASTAVKPNVFLMMDDSGSMAWGNMPDDSTDAGSTMPMTYGFYGARSAQCNGVYYDPAITYLAPVDYTGTSYANASFTGAWSNGYNTGSGTTNLDTSFKALDTSAMTSKDSTGVRAYYYAYSGTQTTSTQRNYYDSTSTFFKECSSALNAAPGNAVFSKRTLATTETTNITISAASSAVVDSIKVNGVELMGAASVSCSTNTSCTAGNISAPLYLHGFSATTSGSNVITITGPTSAANYTPVIHLASGTMTYTTDVFPDTTAANLANFANWYSYYRSRILTMKTVTGLAFKPIDKSYRVGFATMNNNGGTDLINLAPFNTCLASDTANPCTNSASSQKALWYAKLYASSTGSSTPLLNALSNAGRLYGHKLSSNKLNTVTANDPIEYSCQQNYTILSTDGFWNDNTNADMNGTAVGNRDSVEPRPQYDGGGVTYTKSTSQVQQSQSQVTQNTTQDLQDTTQIQSSTSSLQSSTGTLQSQTGVLQWTTNLQQSTAPLQWATKQQQRTNTLNWATNLQTTTSTLQRQTAVLQTRLGTLQGTRSRVLMRCNNTASTCGTASLTNSNWAIVTSGSCTTAANVQCSSVSVTGTVNVATQCNTAASITSAAAGYATATITVTSNSSAQIDSIMINGGLYEILAATANCSGVNNSTCATRIATQINACTSSISGTNCEVAGFSASVSTNIVTITAPAGTPFTSSPAPHINSGSATLTVALSTPVTTYTLNNADSNGNLYSACSYSWGAWANATSSCATNKSTTSPYTIKSATDCQYADPSTGTTGWGAWSNVAASGSCTTAAQSTTSPYTQLTATNCQLTGSTAAYVGTYPPICTASGSYNNPGTSTANASGQVVTCSNTGTTYSTATSVGANGTCNGGLANVKCSTSGTATAQAYVTTYPPTCTVFNATGLNTANSSGNVQTSCPTVTSYSTATAVGPSGVCDGTISNIQCSTGTATTAYISTYPPVCTASGTFNAAGLSTANGSGNIVTCPAAGAFNTTWTNVTSGGTCTPGSNVNCRYNWGSWTNSASCTINQSSGAGTWNITSGTNCQYSWSAAANVASGSSCTEMPADTGPTYTTATARHCSYTGWAVWVNANSCTNNPQSTSSPYSVTTATQCQTTDTGWVGVPAGSCLASPLTNGRTVTCNNITTTPTLVASCTPAAASAGNNWTQTICSPIVVSVATPVQSCTPVTADPSNNYTTTTCTTVTTGPTAGISNCYPDTASASNSWTTTLCTSPVSSGGTSNTLADVAEYYYATDMRSPAGPVVAPETTAFNNCTGALGTNVCENNVRKSGLDSASWQHMTTFTLGLGARGKMAFSPTYLSDLSGDFYSVWKGLKADSTATPPICSWQTNNSVCNWPIPNAAGVPENIDDLWHAAVNGRGSYFSATNATSLNDALNSALAGVQARSGSSAAASTSNPNVTSGDNFVFSTTFTTNEWDGELVRQQLDLNTGSIITHAVNGVAIPVNDWSAQTMLDARAYTTRKVYTRSSGGTASPSTSSIATTNLLQFNATNFGSNSNFTHTHIDTLTQFCTPAGTGSCLSAADTTAAAGTPLVNFLLGDHSNESSDTTKYFRLRPHTLGDIVDAEAVYVKGSLFNYADNGYSTFISTNVVRQGMVYGAANDGMLHAFYSTDGCMDGTTGQVTTCPSGTAVAGGDEAWAYIPTAVIPNLYKLADKDYNLNHQYFVDGTPVSGDVYFNDGTGAKWHTILVGGLNAGGRSYYALDITNPAQPKSLWEFSDTNMGYTYGNPVITKLKTGQWVVLVTSGYNNVSPGDGVGRLYVLDAGTGALVTSVNPAGTPGIISTGAGSTGTPSGLSRINALVISGANNDSVIQVYGGDLLGNVWRFDVNGDVGASGYDAQLLINLGGQPITAKPEVGIVADGTATGAIGVFVGTGRYLGASDLIDTSQRGFYGIKDTSAGTSSPGTVALYTSAPGSNTCANTGTPTNCFVQQVETNSTCPSNAPTSICLSGEVIRSSTNNSVDWSMENGWYINLPDSGERDNTDPVLQLGTLGFTSNVPNVSACTVGGYSYRWFLDYRTGGPVSTAAVKTIVNGSTVTTYIAGTKLGNELATRPVYVRLPNNTVIELTRLSGGETASSDVPIGGAGLPTRRTSWRELLN
ncbi:MAG: hypothetical protein HY306_01155 [Nitrosomonadales bacterium]|nr:hypothetical protein [Nitrosomonadales bacterium]